MATRIREFSWSATPLGSIDAWSARLRAAVEFMLDSPMLACLAVGPARIVLFNDVAARHLGDGHRTALGRSLDDAVAGHPSFLAPSVDRVFAGGNLRVPDQRLVDGESGPPVVVDAYFTPVRETDGTVIAAAMSGVVVQPSAREASRDSEKRYRGLFESIDEGYALADVICDGQGSPVDLFFVEANPASERLTGEIVAGRLMSEIAIRFEPSWVEAPGRVALTGQPERLQYHAEALNRWYDVFLFKPDADDPGSRRVAVVFQDVTTRRAAETILRESEERQAFLLRLSDAMRPLTRVDAIQGEATRLLGERLAVGWCYYNEFEAGGTVATVLRDWSRDGLPSMVGVHDVSDTPEFLRVLRSGDMFAISDLASYPLFNARIVARYTASGIRSVLGIPLIRKEGLSAVLVIADTTEREWTAFETGLLRDVAERTWAAVERVRAEAGLRDSEARLSKLLTLMPAAVYTCDRDGWLTFFNRRAAQCWGREPRLGEAPNFWGGSFRMWLPDGTPLPHDTCPMARAAQWGESFRAMEVIVEQPSLARITVSVNIDPIYDAEGSLVGAINVFDDITEKKVAETTLLESKARLAKELADSEELRRLSSGLSAEEDREALYASILTTARSLMRADMASIQEFLPERQQLRLLAHRGFTPRSAEFWQWVRADESGTCGRALATDTRIVIADTSRFDEQDDDIRAYRQFGIGAVQSMPLRSQSGKVVGMMSTHWREPRALGTVDFRSFDILARLTADLLDRAKTEAALRESEERQAFLLNFTDALRPLTDEGEIRRRATVLLGEFLKVDRSFISEVDGDGEKMYVREEYLRAGASSVLGDYIVAQFGDFVGAELHAGRLLAVDDVSALATIGATERARYAAVGIEAYLLVHLGRSGQLAAFFTLNHRTPRPWSEADKAVAQQAADRTWIAIVRARAEMALRESEARLRAASSISTVGVLFWGPDQTLQDANEAFLQMTGFSRSDALGRSWRDLTPPEFHEGSERVLVELETTGEGTPHEKQIYRKDGSRWWGIFAARKLGDGFVEFAIDISQQHEARQAQRASEERLQAFGEASQDVLWIRDVNTLQWTYLTPAFETIYGLPREDALAGNNYRSWTELIVDEDRAGAVAAIERVRQGEHVTFDYRIRRLADGTIRWLRNTDFPITDAAGEVVMVGGVGHDLTELRETEMRLQTLIKGIPQLVWRAVDIGHWTWASPQWTEFTGQSMQDSLDFGWLDTVHPGDHERVLGIWSEAIARGAYEADYRIRHAQDGRYRWFQTRATPVHDAAGRIVEWLGTSTDIDDQRDMQERQKVLLAELQHRVRNILALLRSITARTAANSPDVEQYASHLAGRLDALARTQSLLTRAPGEDVDLEGIVRDELLAQTAQEQQFTLDGPAVPLAPKLAEVLTLALHELATNSIKYGALSAATGHVDVRWTTSRRDGHEWLDFAWSESGVRVVAPAPRRVGFGTELIERRVPYELDGEGRLDFRPGGAYCTLAIPLQSRDSVLHTDAPSLGEGQPP